MNNGKGKKAGKQTGGKKTTGGKKAPAKNDQGPGKTGTPRPTVQEKVKGRPTLYTPEIAAEICTQLACGKSLREVCKDPKLPAESTVRGWVMDDATGDPQGFSAQYARARNIGLDTLADQIIEIADTPQMGQKTKTKGKGKDAEVETTIGDMVERARLQVEARKWYLSKLAPKKYGDKLEIGGGLNLNHTNKDVSEMTDTELENFIKSQSNKGE